ncbi:MAG: hypothetical protein WC819_00135 [Parcubacteria group bacterium]|jgi:hypothetical protein
MQLEPVFVKPSDGWDICKSYVEEYDLAIQMILLQSITEDVSKETRDTVAQLIGYIFAVICRMIKNGHSTHARNMQKIIFDIVNLDTSDPKAFNKIHKKCDEFAAIR